MTKRPLVAIEWEDSRQPVASWVRLSEVEGEFSPCLCRSVGYLVYDGEDVKALAPNLIEDEDEDDVQVSGIIQIPTTCVRSIQPLSASS